MSLAEEYLAQFKWRDWASALAACPLRPGQSVLDLGCGPGDVSALLAQQDLRVTGVDQNAELLAVARAAHPQCRFEQQDLVEIKLPPGSFDGLWCSFTAAYFPDFAAVLARWCTLLKPRAWVCLVEMDDLLGHEPLSSAAHQKIEAFYHEALAAGRYDFRAGAKLSRTLERAGFQTHVTALADRELAFHGPAEPEILQAWRNRLGRMGGLQQFIGSGFPDFSTEFLTCLQTPTHRSHCRVLCAVGTRDS